MEKAKLFCKQNKLSNIEIRTSGRIRINLRAQGHIFHINLVGVPLTKKGLFTARESVLELKSLAMYNFPAFLERIGKVVEKQANLLQQYIAQFLAQKKVHTAPSTYKNYEKKVTKHIIPKFGKADVNAIKPKDIELTRLT